MALYKWKPFTKVHTDAQDAGEEINRLIEENGGQLVPSVIVRSASRKKNPLHPEFIWDDKESAKVQREDRARYLLRNIVVVTQEKNEDQEEKVIRIFVHVESEKAYSTLARVMSNEKLREETIARAWKELQDWTSRYEGLVEFSKLMPIINKHFQKRKRA